MGSACTWILLVRYPVLASLPQAQGRHRVKQRQQVQCALGLEKHFICSDVLPQADKSGSG